MSLKEDFNGLIHHIRESIKDVPLWEMWAESSGHGTSVWVGMSTSKKKEGDPNPEPDKDSQPI